MVGNKADIIARLKEELLPLQGYKPFPVNTRKETGLGPLLHAFPNHVFPQGAIHECITSGKETMAATYGFLCGLMSALMDTSGVTLWIGASRFVFPPALSLFSLNASHVIFVEAKKEKEILWATEEALKCEALAAVVSEVPHLNFTSSRRLQLAVEHSRVTGFIIRENPRQLNTTASVCRWKITPLESWAFHELPGVGFPGWNIELMKVRNGHPGSWTMGWGQGRFQHMYREAGIFREAARKTG